MLRGRCVGIDDLCTTEVRCEECGESISLDGGRRRYIQHIHTHIYCRVGVICTMVWGRGTIWHEAPQVEATLTFPTCQPSLW